MDTTKLLGDLVVLITASEKDGIKVDIEKAALDKAVAGFRALGFQFPKMCTIPVEEVARHVAWPTTDLPLQGVMRRALLHLSTVQMLVQASKRAEAVCKASAAASSAAGASDSIGSAPVGAGSVISFTHADGRQMSNTAGFGGP